MTEQHERKTAAETGSDGMQPSTAGCSAPDDASSRMEEVLRRSQELSRALIEAATVGTYVVQDGKFQYVNPEYAHVSGYTAEELIGTDSLDYVHPEDREEVRQKAIQHLKGVNRAPYEFRLVRKDGGTAWVLERVASVLYRDRRATVGTFLDITEWKRVDEALSQKEHDYRTLCECTLDGLFVIDAETFEVIFANRAAAEMYGFDNVQDAIGANPLDFLPREERERTASIIVEDMFESDLREANEFRTVARDGRELWVSAVGTKTEYQGRAAGLISLRDITERKLAEKAFLESYERMERMVNQTVNALTSVVELRDPSRAGHQRRVAQLAGAIASEMGLPDFEVRAAYMAGLVHDVGDVSTPAEVAAKPSGLGRADLRNIRQQPEVSYDILKTIEFPWPVAEIVLQHRERLDGSGYPAGLSGDDILMESRILGVAEVVEAMTADRPYRPAPGLDAALCEIQEKSGTLYDPEVVATCVSLFREREFRFETQ